MRDWPNNGRICLFVCDIYYSLFLNEAKHCNTLKYINILTGVYIMFQILFSSCRPNFISFLIIAFSFMPIIFHIFGLQKNILSSILSGKMSENNGEKRCPWELHGQYCWSIFLSGYPYVFLTFFFPVTGWKIVCLNMICLAALLPWLPTFLSPAYFLPEFLTALILFLPKFGV